MFRILLVALAVLLLVCLGCGGNDDAGVVEPILEPIIEEDEPIIVSIGETGIYNGIEIIVNNAEYINEDGFMDKYFRIEFVVTNNSDDLIGSPARFNFKIDPPIDNERRMLFAPIYSGEDLAWALQPGKTLSGYIEQPLEDQMKVVEFTFMLAGDAYNIPILKWTGEW